MVSFFKLIKGIDTPTTINVVRKQNGIARYGHVTLVPNEKYELGDDELFINSLKSAKVEKRYTQQLVNQLNLLGIEYEEVFCKSCGGRTKKVSYNVVEVVESNGA